jgi:peptidoglycan hydrolase-like protein with peptidoglycan-binding domain
VIAAAQKARGGVRVPPVIKRAAKKPTALPCSIRAIQRKLDHGLSVDGKLGPATRASIRRFQRAHRLYSDGIVGPKTGRALGLSGC